MSLAPLLLLFPALVPARADVPHPSSLQILSPPELAVFNDWRDPIEARGGFVNSANYAAFQCQWWVDGALVYEGSFDADGRCDTTLDLSRRGPGQHKFAMKAVGINNPALLQITVNALFNGAPEVDARVVGTCVEDTEESAFELDVIIDDVYWEARRWGAVYVAETLQVEGRLYEADGVSPTTATSSMTVSTNAAGHAEARLSLQPPPDDAGPFTWRITVTDPQGAETPYPADGLTAGPLALDAPPVPTWYETLPDTSNAAVSALTWSNDADHSPYLLLVVLEDGDDGIAADVETIFLTSTTSGGTDHQYDCADAYGASVYCDAGADGWILTLPTAALSLDTYQVTLLTADQCTTTDPLLLTIAEEDQVDNDRDGVAEGGVGPDHDCDDDDAGNAAGADAAEAFGNETDADGEAMTGDPAAGYTASGNLHHDGDVDWWAFEVSGDGTGRGENASFSAVLTVPGDGAMTYGDWAVVVETNLFHAAEPNPDTAAVQLHIESPTCTADGTCTYLIEVSGAEATDLELYWWIGVSTTSWSPAMCDDLGAAYSLQVQE